MASKLSLSCFLLEAITFIDGAYPSTNMGCWPNLIQQILMKRLSFGLKFLKETKELLNLALRLCGRANSGFDCAVIV